MPRRLGGGVMAALGLCTVCCSLATSCTVAYTGADYGGEGGDAGAADARDAGAGSDPCDASIEGG